MASACPKIRAIAAVEFERIDHLHHDREIVRTLPGDPRGGFFVFGHFSFGAGSGPAPRHGRFGGSPEPETGGSPAAAIFVFEFSGMSFNGRTPALQAGNVGSIPAISTNTAVIVQWQDVSLSVSQRGFDSR